MLFRLKIQVYIAGSLLFFNNIFADIKGSNTTPSREAGYLFPSGGAGSNNEMRGFAAFEGGFTLADSTTSCLYNDYFPISSLITLNNGLLNLNRSLSLASNAQFTNAGKINGN